ncbi:MAG: hypothetical protein IJT90_06170 [Bacteroidaceae bacterium]|nr:hypothetical protein [Bacteroidaceae bacterium]
MHLHKADCYFALLLAYFLIWGAVLAMPDYSLLNVGRIVMRFALLAVMLAAVLALVAYLRGKPLFGRSKSMYFSWGRVVPVSVIVSGGYVLLNWLALPSPVAAKQWIALLALFVGGCIVMMLYFYSLVQKPK